MRIQSAEFVTSVGRLDQLPVDGLSEVAVAGRSNVGKSSLMNRLFNTKKLVKTSGTPGKTRTLNYFLVNSAFYMVDLPGYGFAKRSFDERAGWARLVNGYLEDREPLRGIIQLVDARHDPSRQDLEMLEWLVSFERPFLVVATKSDKLSRSRLKPRLDRTRATLNSLGCTRLLPFSATSGLGRDEVEKWIGEVASA